MTGDEKLAVIAGNIRESVKRENRTSAFIKGTLYELVEIAAQADDSAGALDTARLVLPDDSPELLADFCKLYAKYHGDRLTPLREDESSDRSDAVAIPEIGRLTDAVEVLRENGIMLTAEYGDSFASCAEDVQYGNSRYVLMPVFEPEEGRIRSFDRLRNRYGLKIHCVVYVSDENGGEYGYQLCGLGIPDETVFPYGHILFTAETKCDPMRFLKGILAFDTDIEFAETIKGNTVNTVTAILNTEKTDSMGMCGLLMYLNATSDLSIDGCYAEIHHKSKGF